MAGHNVTVLTTAKIPTSIDFNFSMSGFKVISVNCKTSLSKSNNTADEVRIKKKNWIKHILSKYITKTGTVLNDARFPNIFQLWVSPAIKKMENEQPFDVAVATYAPFASFIIAKKLKKRGIVKKMILDYRDLWIENHISSGIAFFSPYEKYLEFKICKMADHITTVSEPLANTLRKKSFVKQVSVIPNGFDVMDLQSLSNEIIFKNDSINIVFTGSYYADLVNPIPLFEAVKQLKDESFFKLDKVQIYFAGARSKKMKKLVQQYTLEKYIHCVGFVPREDALRMQRDADILLFLESEFSKTDGILTGKLFEYMFSGTPIWTIGKKWQPSRMVEKLGLGKALGNDVQLIKSELISLLQGNIPSKHNAMNISELQQYTREYQAKQIAQIIKNVVKK
jgi:glycosyltransferase involved in cell wall biosynthesis